MPHAARPSIQVKPSKGKKGNGPGSIVESFRLANQLP
jgi:hypothetical protein